MKLWQAEHGAAFQAIQAFQALLGSGHAQGEAVEQTRKGSTQGKAVDTRKETQWSRRGMAMKHTMKGSDKMMTSVLSPAAYGSCIRNISPESRYLRKTAG